MDHRIVCIAFALPCTHLLHAQQWPARANDDAAERTFQHIHELIDQGRLQEADSLIAHSFQADQDSPRSYFERARLDVRRGDSLSYCRDLSEATAAHLPEVSALYRLACVRVDSGGLSDFALDSTQFPGIAKVMRYRLRQEVGAQYGLFDGEDSLQVGFIVEGSDTLFTYTPELTEFEGGQAELYAFMRRQLRYPELEADAGIQGRVRIRFRVGIDGRLSHVEVVHHVSPGLDAEALRVVKLMPPWKPGAWRGRPVPFSLVLPVVFKLM